MPPVTEPLKEQAIHILHHVDTELNKQAVKKAVRDRANHLKAILVPLLDDTRTLTKGETLSLLDIQSTDAAFKIEIKRLDSGDTGHGLQLMLANWIRTGDMYEHDDPPHPRVKV